ncbi:MAG: hypothetical protein F6J95_028135 [Leptolyngbya sp. SIO1E4]|nr:hypothetical protein [Leptolyngbya sp. SIO1E4]
MGSPLYAQSVTQATITEILEGNQVYIQDRQVQVNSVARQQQRVRTGTARAALLFNTGAVARLAHNSSLTVGQCARLQQGTLLVNGTLNGCTGSTVAGVRGTLYTLTVDQAGVETLQVFEGAVEVTHPVDETVPPPEDPETPPGETSAPPALWGPRPIAYGPIPSGDIYGDIYKDVSHGDIKGDTLKSTDEIVLVEEGQSLIYDPESRQGFIQQLSADDFEQLINGPLVADFTTELPGLEDLRGAFERLFPDLQFPRISIPTPPIPKPSIPTPPIPIPSPF